PSAYLPLNSNRRIFISNPPISTYHKQSPMRDARNSKRINSKVLSKILHRKINRLSPFQSQISQFVQQFIAMSEISKIKVITLTPFTSSEYHLWTASAITTFKAYKVDKL